jgi:hypothetical protein
MSEEHNYAELWALVALFIAVLGVPIIESFYKMDVLAHVVMTPVEDHRRVFATAYDNSLATS